MFILVLEWCQRGKYTHILRHMYIPPGPGWVVVRKHWVTQSKPQRIPSLMSNWGWLSSQQCTICSSPWLSKKSMLLHMEENFLVYWGVSFLSLLVKSYNFRTGTKLRNIFILPYWIKEGLKIQAAKVTCWESLDLSDNGQELVSLNFESTAFLNCTISINKHLLGQFYIQEDI